MNILITGGAGYIGSHVVKQLLEETKHKVIIIDNLSTGNLKTLETLLKIRKFDFCDIDLNDDYVNDIIKKHQIDVVMHFAASIVVPESIENPIKYYFNNTANTTKLIKFAKDNNVKKFIFSSTAATYAETNTKELISEDFEQKPINPYGYSKLMSEQILRESGLSYVIFRYFNVAGADIKNRIGQSFPNATHLIKAACECITGKRDKMFVFGSDFNTNDGTGVRDYIHVEDLAAAHILAIDYEKSNIFNVGYGNGFSVLEVIKTIEEISNKKINYEIKERRIGDAEQVVSNNSKIKKELKWIPKYNDLNIICKTALEWEKQLTKNS